METEQNELDCHEHYFTGAEEEPYQWLPDG